MRRRETVRRGAAAAPRARTLWGARRALALGALCVGMQMSGCGRAALRGDIHFADALESLALGDTARALEQLEWARYERPSDARVLFHLGRLKARGGIEDRVQAQQALLEAIRCAPDVGHYREALGELLRRQRYTRASTHLLSEAVRLDASLERAWMLLGQNMQERYFDQLDTPANLDSAVHCYEHSLAANPDNDEVRYRLAFLAMHRGQLQRARELARPFGYARSCPGRFGLLLAAIEWRGKKLDLAQRLIDAALSCMSWEEREPYVGLRCLLHPDSVGVWDERSSAERDSLSLQYWWSNDPTPTSMTNERFIEHIARVVDASFYFEVPFLGRPGCATDRGEIYQRFGPPLGMQRIAAREFAPGWQWVYGDSFTATFDFYDEYLNGDYLLQRRTASSDFSQPLLFEIQPVVSRLQFPAPPVNWSYAMRFFRGVAGRTAVEIAVAVDRDAAWQQLALEAAAWKMPGVIAAERRALFEPAQLYRLPDGRGIARMRFELPSARLFLGLQATALRRPLETLADAKQPEAVQWMAFGRDTLEVARWSRDELALSDIMLAYEVRDGVGGLFDMGGVIAVPRVDGRIEGEQLDLYFEIYPSRAILNQRRAVAVRYEVRSRSPETFRFWDQFKPSQRQRMDPAAQASVRAGFTYKLRQDTERQKLRIDVSALAPGPYVLTVELHDPVSERRVSRSVNFTLHGKRQPRDSQG